MKHIPALLDEVIEKLHLKPGMNVIDCTLGDAGHAEKMLEMIAPNGKLLGIDADNEAIVRAKQFLHSFGDRVIFARENFSKLKDVVDSAEFGKADAILMDLGWSSPQFEERGRGFSFQKDEPLDMRYGGERRTAAELIADATEQELEKIFREYGEEKLSREIAIEIVEYRKKQQIERVNQLVEIILDVYRKKLKSKKEIPWIGGLHPATKVFQALRIAVNDELEVLRASLPEAVNALSSRGRLAVITFHSLEDRIVKHFFKDEENKTIRIINKKPVVCGNAEAKGNPRARSAKLRVAEHI